MKKILFLVVLSIFFSANSAFAKLNQGLFVFRNTDKNSVEKSIVSYLQKHNLKNFYYDKENDFVYFQTTYNSEPNAYYIKFYKYFNDTNIYIVSKYYDMAGGNKFSKQLRSQGYNFYKIDDKELKGEYYQDFYKYSTTQKPEYLTVFEKKNKTFAKVVNKLDDQINKVVSVPSLPYLNDADSIDLKKLDSTTKQSSDIKITRNTYRLKNKTNKFVHAYEYVITNNYQGDLILGSIETKDAATWKDIMKNVIIDFDTIDAMKYTGGFLMPFTLGISGLACIPSFVRTAKIAKETKRFTRNLPKDFVIKPHQTVKVLLLANKGKDPEIKFIFKHNGENLSFLF